MNDLVDHIGEIHTTASGVLRIKRNLKLENADVVEWCKEKIRQAGEPVRKGKNWYIHTGDAIITVNAHSYTIITAHIKKNGGLKHHATSDHQSRADHFREQPMGQNVEHD